MTVATTHSAVSTFAQKVDRLEKSSLWKFMTSTSWRVAWDFQTDQAGEDALMPDVEHLEAYVLNLRFFIQDNEPTSLRNIGLLYESDCQDPSLVAQFNAVRDMINSELDRSTWFRFNGQTVTYGAIFMGMIYSEFAHADRNKHALFQQMSAHGFGYMLAMDSFLRCVHLVHRGLVLVRNLNASAFLPHPTA